MSRMAASGRPNPADARVPCPLCGGLIHPIAGKCKHCKGDLSALRGARPSAVASLPSLLAGGAVEMRPHAKGVENGHVNGHYVIADDAVKPPPVVTGAYMPRQVPPPSPQHAGVPMPMLDGQQP